MAALLCVLVFAATTQIGGLGATIYAGYFNTLAILIGILIFAYKIFFSGSSNEFPLGTIDKVYDLVKQANGPVGNADQSYLTMISKGGFMFGIINIIGK